jgi:hypothetical protein
MKPTNTGRRMGRAPRPKGLPVRAGARQAKYQKWAEDELKTLAPDWVVGVLRQGNAEWMVVVSTRADGIERPNARDTLARDLELLTSEAVFRSVIRILVEDLKAMKRPRP